MATAAAAITDGREATVDDIASMTPFALIASVKSVAVTISEMTRE